MNIVKHACAGCPFIRTKGAVRLRGDRIIEIIETDGPFVCHKIPEDICAGWVGFHHKTEGEHAGQFMRILGRLGHGIEHGEDERIFDTLEELENTAI